jgi:hypothetical protein
MEQIYPHVKHFILLLPIWLWVVLISVNAYCGEIKVNDGKTSVNITSNTYQSISLTSSISSIQFRNIQSKAGPFVELFMSGYGYSDSIGDPKLPVFHKLIETPLNSGFSISITNTVYKEYDLNSYGINYRIIPAQPPLSKNITDPDKIPFVINSSTYLINDWLGGPLVKIIPQGILRSLNLARIDISPIWYNPFTGKLRVYEKMDIKVIFTNGDIQSTIQLKKQTYSPYFSKLNEGIINFKQMPDSLIIAAPVTYVIVADPAFRDALQSFITWKKKKGFNVIVGYTNNPLVGNTNTSIKNYLQDLYNNPPAGWQKPSFVLFAGDVAQIPPWTVNGHPSDMYYCDYTGDNMPDVFYGRFAAQTVAQLQAYIDKTLEYEQYTMPSDAFLGEVTMVAGSDPTNGPLYGNGQINYGTSTYFNFAHQILSHTYLQPEPNGGNYAQQIHQNVSNGVAFANYTAHGSEDGWANPEFLIADIAPLQNNHKYCLMVGNCCKTANFGTDCFAKEVTRTPGKGALGYIGCSDYSYWDEDYWWADGFKTVTTNPVYDPQHRGAYDGAFHDHGENPSEWFVTMDQMVFGGQLAVQESSSGIKLYYWETYCLMGDPSLSVYYSIPSQVSATYPSVIISGTTSMTVNTEPYAYVAVALHDTTLLGAKTADSSGIVFLSFSPQSSPDSLSIVVTKQNRKPKIGEIHIVPATGPYVILSNYSVSDSLGGNNNHLPDYGEQITINVTVTNIGVFNANNVTGTLTTTDTNVTITSGIFNFGTIPTGGSVNSLNAFALNIHILVDDQHPVYCNLALTDGTNTWNSTLMMTLNAPVLVPGTVTILDPAPSGNNNGILDPGESATIVITTANTGHAVSVNSLAHLTVASTSTSYILVTAPDYYLGTIYPNGSLTSYFPVTTNGITPDGTVVNLNYHVTGGQMNQYSAQTPVNLTIGQAPVYIMRDSVVTTCNGQFYDSGGPVNNYNDNENFIYTFIPGTPGAKINASFPAFDVEYEPNCDYDWLKVFDGPDTTASLLGKYCGNNLPGPFTGTTGPLTFQFSSDYSTNYAGWTANISCVDGPLTMMANAFPSDVCLGNSSQLVAIPTGGSGNYSYQWNPSTYLDNPLSRTPISTPAADISYTVTMYDGNSSVTSSVIAIIVHPIPPTPVITLNGGVFTSNSPTGNQWYLNNALIPGATNPIFTPVTSGEYYVVVTDPASGCQSETSNRVILLFTGLELTKGEETVSISPNPFHDNSMINFEIREKGPVKITLFDAFGKVQRIIEDDMKQNAGKYRVGLEAGNLQKGIYFVNVQTPEYTVSKKALLTN